MEKQRLLLIGWDAADWRMIRPLLDAGKMPNLQKLIDGGVWGNLRTLHPVLSPMLWTSIATGKRPYKHGIYGFSEPDPSGSSIRPITNLSRKSKAVWNILNQSGKQCNVVGWWPSHPAEPINGVMVSNHFQVAGKSPKEWPLRKDAVHPERLRQPLKELRLHPFEIDGDTLLPFVPKAAEIDQKKDKHLLSLAKIIAENASIHAAGTGILQLEPWDFMAIYYDGIDHFGHGFMKYHPPQDPRASDKDFELYKDVMEGAYRFHDLMLGTLLGLIDERTNVMLISDHGFHPDHLRPKTLPNAPAGPASEHRDYGIFVASGPAFAKGGKQIHTGSLLDIAPTILHLFDLPAGEDMDGKVLEKAFAKKRPTQSIETWEQVDGDTGQHSPDARLDPKETEAALQQLVELGYIDAPNADRTVAVKETIRELDYNLAQAYIDAKDYVKAREIAARLWEGWPEESRFGLLQLNCELAIQNPAHIRATYELLQQRTRAAAVDAQAKIEELRKQYKEADKKIPEDLSENEALHFRKLLKRANVDEDGIRYYGAQVLIAEKSYDQADTLLKQLVDTWPGRQRGLFLRLGEVALYRKQTDEAIEWLEKALELDPDYASAHLQLARAYLRKKDHFSGAAHALQSLQLHYVNPRAHYYYGIALTFLGHNQWAREALEEAVRLNPHFEQAHEELAKFYETRLKNTDKAAAHRQLAAEARDFVECHRNLQTENEDEAEPDAPNWEALIEKQQVLPSVVTGRVTAPPSEQITVVTGLPRSGTSLAMQLLEAAGIDPLTDHLRAADESNRKGYYEFEAVKKIQTDCAWLEQAKGKAVKIVVPLVKFLPPQYQYNIIFMERAPHEVMHSQTAMLERSGRANGSVKSYDIAKVLFGQLDVSWQSLSALPHCNILRLNFNELMTDDGDSLNRFYEFLQNPELSRAAIGSVCQSQLYRSR